jgi:hypothetical protein
MAATVAHRAGFARRWHGIAEWSRRAALAGTVLLALVGAVSSSPAVTLLWAPAVGLVLAGAVALAHPGFPASSQARRTSWLTGWAGALLVPATSGLGVLGEAAAVVVVALLALAALWASDVVAEAPETSEGIAARRDLGTVRRVADELSVDGLLREWRIAAARLGPQVHPEARAAAVEIRALVIDQLARRDPAGLEHWLHHGDGDPDRYVVGGPPSMG